LVQDAVVHDRISEFSEHLGHGGSFLLEYA
jgi:hypothetical protein